MGKALVAIGYLSSLLQESLRSLCKHYIIFTSILYIKKNGLTLFVNFRYHIPRAFLKPKDNLLAIFEEIGGNIDGVQIVTVNRNTICSYIKESDPTRVNNRKREDIVIQKVFDDARRSATLMCPDNRKILRVEFASYGNPFGACGNYILGNCSAPSSKRIIKQVYHLSSLCT